MTQTNRSWMTVVFQSHWWSVNLPEGWETRVEENGVSFRQRPEIGVLQISAARKEAAVTDADLIEFTDTASNATLEPVEFDLFSGFARRQKTQEQYLKEWWLRHGELAIFATYVVPVGCENVEATDIHGILTSLVPAAES